jgi:Ca-activated chloride channel homolog
MKSMSFRPVLFLLITTSMLLGQTPGFDTHGTQPLAAMPAAQPASPESSHSGDSSHSDDQPETVLHAIVNEVNLVFTVTDKHRRFVKNLAANDIRLLDDNKPPAKVTDFRTETDLPLRVGLLVDVSGSVKSRFSFEQQAAIEFLTHVIRRDKDLAFITGFDTTPEVTQDFTSDIDKLSQGVHKLRPGGGTALYDALYFACRDKMLKQQSQVATRRAIILVSDGEDNQSRISRDQAIEMAQRADVIIYGISTNVSGTKTRGDKVLERLAEATGGRALFPFKIQDVAHDFSEIHEELRSQYAISYKPADFAADGRYRTIQIVTTHKQLKARARKGYFAPRADVQTGSEIGNGAVKVGS